MNMNTTRCMICHRPLTDETSVRMGVGSDCRARMIRTGWKFPKPRFKVQNGHSILMGFTGAVEPPKDEVLPATKKLAKQIEERMKGRLNDNEHES